MSLEFKNNLYPISIREITSKSRTRRLLRSSVIIPSQQQSFAVCTEVILNWFLDKFDEKYFNSIYVDGSHSFDEFRKLSRIDQQLRKTNPILAVLPNIDLSYNREWIDSTPEIPMMLRRSRFEGEFFNDIEHNKGLHLQLLFKSIKMSFLFKMRLDTRAQELDMMEYIKIHHRAGWSETLTKDMDIHVPKDIIKQIAFDNGFNIINSEVENPLVMLHYLNSHSLIPFTYKLRCSTGNNEYFIRVPNCTVHIKSELPTMDDGERQGMLTTNYNIEFPLEVEMTAPYCYTYYSQKDKHDYIKSKNPIKDSVISIMQASMTYIPPEDQNHWALLTSTEYDVDEQDLNKPLDIDFEQIFKGSELWCVLQYTRKIALSPAIFLNFIIFNDANELKYEMDWDKLVMHIKDGIINERTIIGIYANLDYINNTIINVKDLDKKSDRTN